jgi:hypothetical protein
MQAMGTERHGTGLSMTSAERKQGLAPHREASEGLEQVHGLLVDGVRLKILRGERLGRQSSVWPNQQV